MLTQACPQRGEFKQTRLKLVQALLDGEEVCGRDFSRRINANQAMFSRIIKSLGDAVEITSVPFDEGDGRRGRRKMVKAKDKAKLELELSKAHNHKRRGDTQKVVWKHG